MKIEVSEDIATCLRLRRIVFIDEQGVPEVDEVDGLDGEAVHLLASQDALAVGTARLMVKSDALKIGRVCVLPEHRGKGIGQALIEKALEYGRSQSGLERAELGAQKSAISFYEPLGFVAIGPEFMDAGIPHRNMRCPL